MEIAAAPAHSEQSTQPAQPRFAARISLRTLLLFVIYIGSLQLYWFNRHAWEAVTDARLRTLAFNEIRSIPTRSLPYFKISSWPSILTVAGRRIEKGESGNVKVFSAKGQIEREIALPNGFEYPIWVTCDNDFQKSPICFALSARNSGMAINVTNGRTIDISDQVRIAPGKCEINFGEAVISIDGSTLLLHKVEPNKPGNLTIIDTESMTVRETYAGVARLNAATLETNRLNIAFDVLTGARIDGPSPFAGSIFATAYEASKIFVLKADRCEIVDRSSHQMLAFVDAPPMYNSYQKIAWLPHCRELLIGCDAELFVYHNRRPEEWWGNFYLWQFWFCAAFLAAFVWSILHDRRTLGRTVPA